MRGHLLFQFRADGRLSGYDAGVVEVDTYVAPVGGALPGLLLGFVERRADLNVLDGEAAYRSWFT